MPDLTRRSLLGGALVVVGAMAVPSALRGKPMPVIWGDGVHDDGPGFRAALAGEPFMCAREGMVIAGEGRLSLRGGHFRFTDTLDLSVAKIPATVIGSHLSFRDMPLDRDCGIDIRKCKVSHRLAHCVIEGNGHAMGVIVNPDVKVTQLANGNWTAR